MQTVKLKNGAEAPRGLVTTTMLVIDGLLKEGFGGVIIAYDLVMLCRDPDYDIFAENARKLADRCLVTMHGDKAKPHGAIKDIVLSSATGDGMEMSFGSPVAEAQ